MAAFLLFIILHKVISIKLFLTRSVQMSYEFRALMNGMCIVLLL